MAVESSRSPSRPRACVIGAGVMGVTSAYFLARAGFDVTVLESRPPPVASVTSYANAGVVRVLKTTPLASPDSMLRAVHAFWTSIKSVFTQTDGPVNPFVFSWKLPTDPIFWRWGGAFVRNCAVGYKSRIGFLDVYGRFCVHALHETVMAEGLAAACDYGRAGSLVLYEGQKEWATTAAKSRTSTDMFPLTKEETLAREPSMKGYGDKLAGGFWTPTDVTGDCHKFSRRIKALCERQLGVKFRFNSTVTDLKMDGGRVTAAITDNGQVIEADEFVVAVGPTILRFMQKVTGVYVPVYPMVGYSLTIPIRDKPSSDGLTTSEVPKSLVISHDSFIHMTRFPARARFVSIAELRPIDAPAVPSRDGVERLRQSIWRLFPELQGRLIDENGQVLKGSLWCGQRPVSADGVPIVSPVSEAASNLWVNGGQGSMGFKFSCGSAQILAWLVSEKHPEAATMGRGKSPVSDSWRGMMMTYTPLLSLERFRSWSVVRPLAPQRPRPPLA